MINELYQLSSAMESAGIQAKNWHRKYLPIPNIKANVPCVRICLSEGKVVEVSSVNRELGAEMRKYGTNQGSYPCMNLAPLYRVTDENVKKEVSDICQGKWDSNCLERIKGWCVENNWKKKFLNKYKVSMVNITEELKEMLGESPYEPLLKLIEETDKIAYEPLILHKELETVVFQMLERRENVALALYILFYLGSAQKKAEDDYGSLSVAFDSKKLIDSGMYAVSVQFVEEFNEALLYAESIRQNGVAKDMIDAFGMEFAPIEEPMPKVKLAGGFDVTLRTMFKAQYCQTRYGKIENASYPISPLMRKKLQSALEWLGDKKQEDFTWTNIDAKEILFAYPSQLPQAPISFTRVIKRPKNEEGAFRKHAEKFISEIKYGREKGTDSCAEYIQIFILRKIDKAKTKIVYTRQTDAKELEICSELWISGCENNVPAFRFGAIRAPFLDKVADILNCIWKQDGTKASSKFKSVQKYHGIELFFNHEEPVLRRDLHILVQAGEQLGTFLGKLNIEDVQAKLWYEIKDMIALMGLLLYQLNVRKETYMESIPYLYGQLLKISDELHTLYCNVERKGSLPAQLAGGSLFRAAVDAPMRTFNLLGQRMAPYIIWAKSYRTKKIMETGVESWRAGWLLGLYEMIADQLKKAWVSTVHFDDEEKAQLFIGYLASLPKKERSDEKENISKSRGGERK